ncbi:hypothetical protein JNK13_00220 [bacterium]|nr:hypothetical protein [bacterium]
MSTKNKITFFILLTLFPLLAAAEDQIPWEASVDNWGNSPFNYENSKFNIANSPDTFANSKDNPNRINIKNLLGIVTGYAVAKPNGYVNYFDNDGDRIGYSLDGGKTAYDDSGKPTTFKVSKNSE